MKSLLAFLSLFICFNTSAIDWSAYKIGIGYTLNYFQPFYKFNSNSQKIEKYPTRFDLYTLTGSPSITIARDKWMLEYSSQHSYNFDVIAYKNNHFDFKEKYGIDIFLFDYISSTNAKRHTLFLTKKISDAPLSYYFGLGLGLVVTPNTFFSYSDSIITTNGTFYRKFEKKYPSKYVSQIGIKAGFSRSVLKSGLSIFGELHYLQGLWKSDTELLFYKINSDILQINSFTRSSTFGGSFGLRYELDFSRFKSKK